VNKKLNILSTLVLLNILVTLAWMFFEGQRYQSERDQSDLGSPPAPLAVQAVPVSLLGQLKRAYGPKLYSQFDEETLIRHFFKDLREGFFVDVGSGDYQRNSTTYYLEKHLGWKGIAIDANPSYQKSYAEHRPQTRFFSRFVTDSAGEVGDFFLPVNNPDMASGSRENVLKPGIAKLGEAETQIYVLKVPTITLNKLLDEERVKSMDFLSMDIEGAEPAALAGFDINRFKPKLVCIEVDHASKGDLASRGLIEGYFKRNGYQRIEEYVPLDPASWYFVPAGSGRKVRRVPGQ